MSDVLEVIGTVETTKRDGTGLKLGGEWYGIFPSNTNLIKQA